MALKDDSNHTKYSKSANSDFGCLSDQCAHSGGQHCSNHCFRPNTDFGCLSDQCAQSGGQHCSNHCFRPNQMYRYITTRSLPR